MGGGGEAAAPHFLHIYYGPSVACTVGCTWLMYSLCMAHIWPMYDLHMARRAPRDLSPLIYRTVVDCSGLLRCPMILHSCMAMGCNLLSCSQRYKANYYYHPLSNVIK